MPGRSAAEPTGPASAFPVTALGAHDGTDAFDGPRATAARGAGQAAGTFGTGAGAERTGAGAAADAPSGKVL